MLRKWKWKVSERKKYTVKVGKACLRWWKKKCLCLNRKLIRVVRSCKSWSHSNNCEVASIRFNVCKLMREWEWVRDWKSLISQKIRVKSGVWVQFRRWIYMKKLGLQWWRLEGKLSDWRGRSKTKSTSFNWRVYEVYAANMDRVRRRVGDDKVW